MKVIEMDTAADSVVLVYVALLAYSWIAYLINQMALYHYLSCCRLHFPESLSDKRIKVKQNKIRDWG
jgi:hypothetical protein